MYNMNIYKKNTVVNYIHEIDITKVFLYVFMQLIPKATITMLL
jgi:hypothetical protein